MQNLQSPFGQMLNLQKSIRTNAELTIVNSDKCRTYKSPFGQMQNLQKCIQTNAELTKSIRTNAELTKVHSDKCRTYKIHSDKCRTYKIHSDKCRTDKSPFGQMQNLKKLVRNSDKCMRPPARSHHNVSRANNRALLLLFN